MLRPLISFYVRGSASEGLGHVVRSAHLVRALVRAGAVVSAVVEGDERAKTFFTHRCGGLLRDFENPDAWVVDATEIGTSVASRILEAPVRALLSPKCASVEVFTIAFLRAQPREPLLAAKVFSGLNWSIIDPTLADLRRLRRPTRAKVGVCLSGSDDVRLKAIAEALAPTQAGLVLCVADIAAVQGVDLSRFSDIVIQTGVDGPWGSLGDCDAAIVGDGVVVDECAAAGVAVVALTERGRRWKLQEYEDARAATIVENSTSAAEAAIRLVKDECLVLAQTTRARALVDGCGAGRVAAALLKELGA
jgi:spore coat polysaccharide biosynthesis predicted glycosyltransferase SpsG